MKPCSCFTWRNPSAKAASSLLTRVTCRALSTKQRGLAAASLLALGCYCQVAVASEALEHGSSLQGGGLDRDAGEHEAHSLQHFNDHHRELCTWQSSYKEPSSYHYAVEKIGYPTEYELLVSKNQYIEDVACPVCGAEHQTVGFVGKNLRYVLRGGSLPTNICNTLLMCPSSTHVPPEKRANVPSARVSIAYDKSPRLFFLKRSALQADLSAA